MNLPGTGANSVTARVEDAIMRPESRQITLPAGAIPLLTRGHDRRCDGIAVYRAPLWTCGAPGPRSRKRGVMRPRRSAPEHPGGWSDKSEKRVHCRCMGDNRPQRSCNVGVAQHLASACTAHQRLIERCGSG